ncbi:hypothetical protein BT93_K0997 [Corymbia citriodora subsp. variegata]|nr:hypothetical protein BT93_K0997 [Corymbia citriodora subsp. variegata]
MRPVRLPEPPSGFAGVPDALGGAVRRALVIGNGFAGAENQCIGLVRALGLADRHSLQRVTRPRGGINEWLHWIPVSFHKKINYVMKRVWGDSRFQTAVESNKVMPLSAEKSGLLTVLEADPKQIAVTACESFEKEGPLLVIASGRDTISAASTIRRLAPDNVFVIQILTVGALHQADSATLRSAAFTWHDELAYLPKPLLVVNIGGPTRNCPYGADLARELITKLQNVLWSCGSLRISFSRRTPVKVSKMFVREFRANSKVHIWDGEGLNPHMGHLAWADAFVVTADSVSMLSEVCSTGKPVYIAGAERCKWKFADFQNSLQERGAVRAFTGKEDISETWSYPPLNDTAESAALVHEALAKRGWRICM